MALRSRVLHARNDDDEGTVHPSINVAFVVDHLIKKSVKSKTQGEPHW